MVEFKEFVKRFSKLPAFIDKEGKKVLKQNEQMLVDMRNKQHHEGKKETGDTIQSGYSTGYAKRRQKAGLQTSFVDLHFTGKMHKGSKVLPVKGGVDIRSREDYEYYVRGNFPGAWGLTKQNAEQVAQLVANELAVKIKKYLVA